MTRTSPTIKVIEIGGDRFKNLEATQESARVIWAFNLVPIIKSMIEQDVPEIKNNQIISDEKTKRKIDNE